MTLLPLLMLLSLVSLVYSTHYTWPTLTVGAFNIQVFGQTKGKKQDVMDNIVKIVSHYDIILIQEIKDKDGVVVADLLSRLNRCVPNGFDMRVSGRLGRTHNTEQLAYFFKKERVTILEERQYNDSKEDVFEREPYSVHIRVNMKGAAEKRLVLMGAHLKPSSTLTVQEIDALDLVYQDNVKHFQNQDMLIMGDLNADCRYLSSAKRDSTKLFTDSDKYLPLIHDDADTTTKDYDCAYDRIFATGDLQNDVVCSGIDYFDTGLGLNTSQMRDVSDHYPVFSLIRLDRVDSN